VHSGLTCAFTGTPLAARPLERKEGLSAPSMREAQTEVEVVLALFVFSQDLCEKFHMPRNAILLSLFLVG
jgi:hypothetical protein